MLRLLVALRIEGCSHQPLHVNLFFLCGPSSCSLKIVASLRMVNAVARRCVKHCSGQLCRPVFELGQQFPHSSSIFFVSRKSSGYLDLIFYHFCSTLSRSQPSSE